MSDHELKAILGKLVTKIDDMTEQATAERERNAEFRSEVRERFAAVYAKFDVIDEHLKGIDKRLDDQNAILAAMIPQKIAAVGGR